MTATRRRGEELTGAILEATLLELAEVGFEGLTFEKVARRANAGKASLYQRWGSAAELVTAALAEADSRPGAQPRALDLGDLREELVCFLADLAEGLSTPAGGALLPLLARSRRHPELYEQVVDLMVRPRQALVRDALLRAAARGEVDPTAITDTLVSAGPQLLIVHHLTHGGATHDDVTRIVDDIVLPAAHREPRRP